MSFIFSSETITHFNILNINDYITVMLQGLQIQGKTDLPTY